MSAGSTYELHQFYEFLGSRLETEVPVSPEESVRQFRTYQEELSRLRAEIQPSLDELDGGRGTEMDFEGLRVRVRQRLAERGIRD